MAAGTRRTNGIEVEEGMSMIQLTERRCAKSSPDSACIQLFVAKINIDY
jgi:hypothetical protein